MDLLVVCKDLVVRVLNHHSKLLLHRSKFCRQKLLLCQFLSKATPRVCWNIVRDIHACHPAASAENQKCKCTTSHCDIQRQLQSLVCAANGPTSPTQTDA